MNLWRDISLVVIVAIVYYGTLYGTFVWDDRAAVVNNPDVRGITSILELMHHDFWGQNLSDPGSHKSYRPITTISYRWNHNLHEFNAAGYHCTNVAIFAASTLVLFRFMICYQPVSVAFLSALIYAVHPIHVEAVANLVGRADALCGLFYVSALLWYQYSIRNNNSFHLVLAIAFALLASLSKEIGVTVFGMFFLLDIFNGFVRDSKKKGNRFLIFIKSPKILYCEDCRQRSISVLVVLVIFIVWRVKLNGESRLFQWTIMENHIHHLPSFKERTLSYAQSHFWYIWKLLYPFHLCFDYGYACLPTVHEFADVRNLLPLAAYIGIVSIAVRAISQCRLSLLVAIAMIVIPLVPASNIIFPVGTLLAERLLLLPSVGISMLISDIVHFDFSPMWFFLSKALHDYLRSKNHHSDMNSWKLKLFREMSNSSNSGVDMSRRSAWAFLFLFAWLARCAMVSMSRVSVWNDELHVYRSALEICPLSVKALANYAALAVNNDAERITAMMAAERAILFNPSHSTSRSNAGLARFRLKDFIESIRHYEDTLSLHPYDDKIRGQYSSMLLAYANTLDDHLARYFRGKASSLLVDSSSADASLPSLHTKASLAMESGDYKSAISDLESIVERYHLGSKNSDIKVASSHTFMDDKFDIGATYNQLANCYLILGDQQRAINTFVKGIELKPKLAALYSNLGSVYRQSGQLDNARDILLKGISQSGTPSEITALSNNLGLVFMDQGDPHSALVYFKKALDTIQLDKSSLDDMRVLQAESQRDNGVAFSQSKTIDMIMSNYRDAEEKAKR